MRPTIARVLSVGFLALSAACATEADGVSGATSGEGGSSVTTGNGGATTSGIGGDPSTTSTTTTTSTVTTGNGGMGQGGDGGFMGQGGSPDPIDYPLETEFNGSLGSSNPLQMDTLGFTATLIDANDIDIFNVTAEQGASMRVAVSNGNGGCPPGANVTVTIYSPDNLQFATKSGLCPLLDGNNTPAMATLVQPGKYFIRVSGSQTVPEYAIEISVANPICGDGVTQLGEECDDMNMTPADGCENDCTETPDCGDGTVQTGEECDDGGTVGGDGCDGVCLLEGNYCVEVEPNGTVGTATPMGPCAGGYGKINPIADVDFYEVDVTVAGSSLRAETVGIMGTGCPTGVNTLVRLYNSAMVQLGNDDDDGNASCSLINPATDAFATNLAIGTYYVSVEESGNNAVTVPYVVLLTAAAPGCGDSIVQSGEECDDGNVMPNDGCDGACTIEGNFCGEVEMNGTIATANSLAGCDGGSGQITPVADRDYFAFQVTTPGSSARLEVTNVTTAGCPVGFDSLIRLYDFGGAELGTDDSDGNDACSLIDPQVDLFARNLAVGTYYVAVEEFGSNAVSQPYLVKALILPPACGDGLTQVGEECDDGDLMDGDGCSSTCTIEGNFCAETEANDTFGQATSLAMCDGGSGIINYVTDRDFYVVDVTVPGSSIRAEVVDITGLGCPVGFTSLLRLYNGSMTQLGNDTIDGNASCSLISPSVDAFAANLPVGTYYVAVEESGSDATSNPYVVKVTASAPGCGDGILQTGEQCDDNNLVDNDGCSSTCQLLACDVGQVAVTIDAIDLPQTIVDDAPGTPAMSNVVVSQTGTVAKLAIHVKATHSWIGDAEFYLDPPGVAQIALADNIGSSSDNMDTIFSSLATTNVTTGTPPWLGIWAPQAPFTPAIGSQANGTWTLKALDNAAGIAGTLTEFSLYLCVQP